MTLEIKGEIKADQPKGADGCRSTAAIAELPQRARFDGQAQAGACRTGDCGSDAKAGAESMRETVVLVGGECDGREITACSQTSLRIPVRCGWGICYATYEPSGERQYGRIPVMRYTGTKHRSGERETIFASVGWEHGLCRAFAESDTGKAFVSSMKEIAGVEPAS